MSGGLGYNSAALPGAMRSDAMLHALGKPVLTVLKWQVAATGHGNEVGWHADETLRKPD